MPWAPTPLHARLPAVRAYVEGESLCDEGQTTDGLAKLKEAIATAWELDLPEWPGWAECLYHQVTHGLVPSGASPPPQLAADTSSSQPAVAALACDGGGWWASEAAVAAIAGALRSRNHVLVDGFLGRDGGLALRGAIEAAWEEGALQPAKVAQPGNGLNGQRSDRTRSDHIAWVDFAAAGTARWGALGTLVTQADSLVQALLRAAPELGGGGGGGGRGGGGGYGGGDGDAANAGGGSGGGGVSLTRMRPMVSRYGVGAAFARHADNHCRRGEGPHCNGRWLTAVYYCNEDWSADDGGCLRLYRPQGAAADDEEQTGEAVCSLLLEPQP